MAYLWLLVVLAFIGTFGWRFLGVAIGNTIDPDSHFLSGSMLLPTPWFPA